MIDCVLFLTITAVIQGFCIKFKQCLLVFILKWITHILKKPIYFPDGCGGQYKNYKNFMDLCSHKDDFGISVEWVMLCDGIDVAFKWHVAKRSLQRPLNNQILDYKSLLDLCENKWCRSSFLEFVRRAQSVLKIFRNNNKVGTLHLSHGAFTISSPCHPRELVIG